MRGTFRACCARAASGHAAAAPPKNVMNSRRLTRSPRRRGRAASAALSRPSALAVLRLIDQLELGRRLHRQVGRLLAFEDAIDVAGRAPVRGRSDQSRRTSGRRGCEVAVRIDRRHRWRAPARQSDHSVGDAPARRPSRSSRHSARVRMPRRRVRSPSGSRTRSAELNPQAGATDGSPPTARCQAAALESRRTAARVTRGAISLSSSSHLPLMPYSNCDEPGGIAARPCQAFDITGCRPGRRSAQTRSAQCGSPAATVPAPWCHWPGRHPGRAQSIPPHACRTRSASPFRQRCRSARCGRPSNPAAAALARMPPACRGLPDCPLQPARIADASHPLGRLLRARSERPRRCRAAEQRDELAPPHSITSSARASSVGGTSRPSALAVVKINDEIEFGRLLDREVGWLCPAQNLIDIVSGASEQVRVVCSVGHETAGAEIIAERMDGRQPRAEGQGVDTCVVGINQRVGAYVEGLYAAIECCRTRQRYLPRDGLRGHRLRDRSLRAAACASPICAAAYSTFPMIASLRRPGNNSRKISIRFPARSGDCMDKPVTLPPGRDSEAARPLPTGSAIAATMGIVAVTCCAALAAPPTVTMTPTLSRTNSFAIAVKRSLRPSAQRYSIATVRPSIQPSSRSRFTKAAVQLVQFDAVLAPRKPIVGTLPCCCAIAASGHAAAAPPSSVMNSRLLIRSPRRRGRATTAGW